MVVQDPINSKTGRRRQFSDFGQIGDVKQEVVIKGQTSIGGQVSGGFFGEVDGVQTVGITKEAKFISI